MKKLFFALPISLLLFASCSKSDVSVAKEFIGKDLVYDEVEEIPMSHDTLIFLAVEKDAARIYDFLDEIKIDASTNGFVSSSDQKLMDDYQKISPQISNYKLKSKNAKKDYNIILFKNNGDVVKVVPIKNNKVDELMINYSIYGYYHIKYGL